VNEEAAKAVSFIFMKKRREELLKVRR